MPKSASPKFDEKDLTKGQLRKLGALRKSLGPKIADKAFAEWLKTQAKDSVPPVNEDAQVVATALMPLLKNKKFKIPRGGFLVTRWRGQVVVKPAASKKN